MQPRIEIIKEKKLVGKNLTINFADYKISELWRSFLPLKNEIKNTISDEMISMAIYPKDFFKQFNPTTNFEKWATVEVAAFYSTPSDTKTYTIPSGEYAIFHYKGLNTDNKIYQHIFSEWLPKSKYELDDRPHFELLGTKHKNNDPNSEEDIYIPVRIKSF